MAIRPLEKTKCGYWVPANTQCSGSHNVNARVCQTCPMFVGHFTEPLKQKSQVCTPKAYPFGEKMPSIARNGKAKIVRHAFAVTVEASM